VERWRERRGRELAEPLRERAEEWAAAHLEELHEAEPRIPGELSDRAQDTAEPLLAIADLAGGEWPQRARAALVELHGERLVEDDSIGVRLLSDIRDAFENAETDSLRTKALLEHLHSLEEAPWSEWSGAGRPLTHKGLADLLRRYRIRSRTVRLGEGSTPKGFKRDQFELAFARYLRSSRHTATTRINADETPGSIPPHDLDVAAAESGTIRLQERDVAGVAANEWVTSTRDDEHVLEAEGELERIRAKWGDAACPRAVASPQSTDGRPRGEGEGE